MMKNDFHWLRDFLGKEQKIKKRKELNADKRRYERMFTD
jgi:hypothetical protein